MAGASIVPWGYGLNLNQSRCNMAPMVDISPDYALPADKKRIFSVQQANRSLPLVERIVQDVLETSRKVRDCQEQFESLQSKSDSKQAESAMLELSKARELYRKFCQELSTLGCNLSDEVSGTVDFPAVVNGRGVILSWRPGESEVSHWHDPGQGPSERRLLSELNE